MFPIDTTPKSRLSALGRGQAARVDALLAQGPMRRRFQDLGLITGTQVECLGPSALGEPCAYLIRGAVIALRRSDADSIAIGPAYPAGEEAEALPSGEADYGTL